MAKKSSSLFKTLAAILAATALTVTVATGVTVGHVLDTNNTQQGEDKEVRSIVSIENTNNYGLVHEYTIYYTDDTTSTFIVVDGANGAPGENGIQGFPGQDGHTPVIEIGANGNWFIDNVDTGVFASGLAGPQGPAGADGQDGQNGITPHIGTNGHWYIGETDTGIVAEGHNGKTPLIGANGNWWIGGTDTGVPASGTPGPQGETGRGIVSIEKTDSIGLVDVYTITYSDNTTSTFVVTNGSDGQAAAQGLPGEDGHTPVIEIGANGNWFVDGVDTQTQAQGPQGPAGQDGITPHIGSNGNWWVGTTDTGIPAQGQNGQAGQNGQDGVTPHIGNNGNWWVGETDLGVPAQGPQGPAGQNGQNGQNGTSMTVDHGEPSQAFGNDGDSYIDLNNYNLYVKENGVWVLSGNIQGAAGQAGQAGQNGVSIVSVIKTGSEGLLDTYTITYSDNSTSTFVITNGQNGAAGHTPVITIDGGTGNWLVDGNDTGVKAQGDTGLTGNGISYISKTGTEGLVDTYRIMFTDGTSFVYTVTNGADGQDGADGTCMRTGDGAPAANLGQDGDSYIDLISWNYYVRENGVWVAHGNIKGANGADGANGTNGTNGQDGQNGVSITNIQKTGTEGLVDTYTISYSDGTSSTFTVTNGAAGQDGQNGQNGTNGTKIMVGIGAPSEGTGGVNGDSYIDTQTWNYYLKVNDAWALQGSIKGADGANGQNGLTPFIGANGNWWIGETDTTVPAQGQDGQDGQNGVTPHIGANGNWWVGETDLNVPAQGAAGQDGQDGVSITGISKTSSDGLVDTYTITYSNSTTSTFTVTNGQNGTSVKTGTGNPNTAGVSGMEGDSYIDLDSWDFYIKEGNAWVQHGNIKGDTGNVGPQGPQGLNVFTGHGDPNGDPANDIDPVEGREGESYIDLDTWNYYVKGATTWVLIDSIQGPAGADGIYITNAEINTDGDLIITLSDLSEINAGNVKNTTLHTVTFDTDDGSTAPANQELADGQKVVKPDDPMKAGYYFEGWYNTATGEEWSFEDVVTADLNLVAIWSQYKVTNGVLTGCTKTGDIVIPATYRGETIVGIDEYLFADRTDVTSVTIPGTVLEIGANAFKNCTNLAQVTISNGVTTISEGAFQGCTSLSSIVIPDTVKTIGSQAFSDCSTLNYVYMKEGLETIGSQAFKNCTSLSNVFVPNSVVTIDADAFQGCNALESIALPFVGNHADSSNDTGTQLRLGYIFGGSASSVNTSNNAVPASLKSVSINGGTVNSSALQYCANIETVYVADGIETLGSYAFANCDALQSINLPDSLKEIEYSCFSFCPELTSLVIPNSVEKIGMRILQGCDKLSSLTIPFLGDKLVSPSSNTGRLTYYFNNSNVNAGNFGVPDTLKTVRITNDSYTQVASYAFYGLDNIRYVYLPDTVTSINTGAFEGCYSLLNFKLPNSLTTVGQWAFRDCNGLKPFNDGNAVLHGNGDPVSQAVAGTDGDYYWDEDTNKLYLYDGAWIEDNSIAATGHGLCVDGITCGYNKLYLDLDTYKVYTKKGLTATNTGLRYITFPSTLTTISESAFENCTNLLGIAFSDSAKPVTIGTHAFKNCVGLKSLAIPSNVTSIYLGAFDGCYNLETIILPYIGGNQNGTTSSNFGYIFGASNSGEHATKLANYTKLKTVVILEGSGVNKNMIPDYAFRNLPLDVELIFKEGITIVGKYAFQDAEGLTKIVLSSSIQLIDNYAFNGCDNLTAITLPYALETIGDHAFEGCTALANVTFGAALKSIGNEAFKNCSALETLFLPENLQYIGNSAFRYCTSLVYANLPGSLQHIDNSAFADCTSLVYVTLNEGMKVMDDCIFSGCTSLKTISFPSSLEVIGWGVIKDCTSIESLSIPSITNYLANNVILTGEGAPVSTIGNVGDVYINTADEQGGIWVKVSNSAHTWGTSPVAYVKSDASEGLIFGEGAPDADFGDVDDNYVDLLNKKFYYKIDATTWIDFTDELENYISADRHSLSFLFGTVTNGEITSTLKVVNLTGGSAIAESAFEGCSYIQYFALPNTLETIGDKAFKGCSSLVSFEMPNTVTSMGEHVFVNCIGLKTISLSQSLTEVSKYAFVNCTSLSSIVIPNGVTIIKEDAFRGCTGLEYFVLSSTVVEIEKNAFNGCTSLESVIIPKTVLVIGKGAFDGCSSMESIVLPFVGSGSSYNEDEQYFSWIFGGSKYDPSQLGSYNSDNTNVPSSLKVVVIDKVSASSVYANTNSGFAPLRAGTATDGVAIYDYSFAYCDKLEIVTFNCDIEFIGTEAFRNCEKLASMVVPDVDYIGACAFAECSGLKSITLPFVGRAKTGSDVYYGTSAPTSVTTENEGDLYIDTEGKAAYRVVNDSWELQVDNLGLFAYASLILTGTGAPTTIPSDNAIYINTNDNSLYMFDTSNGGWESAHLSIKDIFGNDEAFYYIFANFFMFMPDTLTQVTLTNGNGNARDVIPSSAFMCCEYIESVVLPDNIKTIANYAFAECEGLASIVLPNSLETIGDFAFSGCKGLQSIVVPVNTKYIGESAFDNCESLTYVALPSRMDGGYIGKKAFCGCGSLIGIALPETGIDEIREGTFSWCTSLQSIAIPDSFRIIGVEAFEGCNRLTSVGIYDHINGSDSVVEIRDRAFYACYNLKIITLPINLKIIGSYAFGYCQSLEDIVIPDTVIYVGANAFYECKGLKSLVIPFTGALKQYGSWHYGSGDPAADLGSNYDLYLDYDSGEYKNLWVKVDGKWYLDTAFKSCGSGAPTMSGQDEGEAYIDYVTGKVYTYSGNGNNWNYHSEMKDVMKYFGYLFSSSQPNQGKGIYSSLKSVTITKASEIPDYAFMSCNKLEYVIIAPTAHITSIGNYAFGDCTSLKAFSIPSTVEYIGEYAFGNCEFATIDIPNSVQEIGWYAFAGCNKLESINVPFVGGTTSSNTYTFGAYSSMPLSGTDGDFFFDTTTNVLYKRISNAWRIYHRFGYSVTVADSASVAPSTATTENYVAVASGNVYVKSGDTYNLFANLNEGIHQFSYIFCGANGYSPSSVKHVTVSGNCAIADNAFNGNTVIEEINLEGAITFGDGVFAGCTGLKSAVLSNNINALGDNIFEGCTRLETVIALGNFSQINNFAFKGCESLKTINIIDDVTSFGESAFEGCENLEDVVFSDSLNTIGLNAFKNCKKIKSIVVPDHATSIGRGAFQGCNSLESVTIPFVGESATSYQFIGHIFGANVAGSNDNFVPESLKTVVVTIGNGASADEIPYQAFYSCLNIEKVYILSATVVSIGDNAFQDCQVLKAVYYSEAIKNIGNYAFSCCWALESFDFESVDNIGNYAFNECKSLKTAITKKTLMTMGAYAFNKCYSLTTFFAEGFDADFEIDDFTFYECHALSSINLNGVKSIGNNAFARCYALTSAYLSDDLTSIGTGAFEYCISLRSIYIPNSVTTIANETFMGCYSLSEVRLHSNITAYGTDAFYGCNMVTTVIYSNLTGDSSKSWAWYVGGPSDVNLGTGNASVLSNDGRFSIIQRNF